jgi:hypothetical protein
MGKKFTWMENENGDISRSIPITPELREMLQEQWNRFREKFGRDPGPNDQVLFDEPPVEHSEFYMAQAMRRAGMAPEIIYAFEKTGFLVTTMNQDLVPEKDLEDWDNAIEEYFDRKDSGELDDSYEALK